MPINIRTSPDFIELGFQHISISVALKLILIINAYMLQYDVSGFLLNKK